MSQEEGRSREEYEHKFYYDDSAGAGITVYVLDSGANLEHPVRGITTHFSSAINVNLVSAGI